ncbi:IS256 family transposase [Salmonella enterica subsp. enterica serovar Bareilly]|uniref:IS256 family transposase n=7 Tax=Salmonella enterica TaxID=28901 RepID=UPI0002695E8D|nr:IS256 family transposase [Salmonella enterica]EAA4243645.1 IS256 family transposase [Salmonella enterica subsp. enterica serovar Bareilly]EBS2186294.1 IS256 family transposase [Salmonella enterica subsp. enterica serovar Chester]EBW5252585.1 IS256 family transposase [Salmonella enterica subsp. enterica serovar Newport]EBY6777956.1 IS256 family transposase [Salmonella enterica subsp. enterica serovar Nchanga]ECA0973195.1 IS256 family transposase [Salmonella enterica subsp. enterica serovar H
MDEKKLKALAAELAKGLKTEADLNQFSRMLTKLTVETALNAELTDHFGHEKNAPKTDSNTRNGYSSKTVLCDDGEIELNTPRDRENTFEPQLIKKHQTRITQMDSQILSLYAKGMTTREIVATFKEMYDADVSPTLISKVTDTVKEQVTEWQLDALYPIVYMDCIVVKVRQNGSVINKAVFLALGINTEGQKELPGMWLAENEGAKLWLSVLTELKKRGLQDILIACVDGLKGFPDAINSVFPQTHIQLCIIHMVRNSLKYVSWKDYKAVTSGLKTVYQAPTKEAALMALDAFAEVWDDKYPQISKSWRAHWENLNTLFSYPPDIRKAIYTTNEIESLNSVIRAAIKKRKVFPTDDSVRKVIYLAIKGASKKWSMPIQNWRLAMSRFIIEFGDRLSAEESPVMGG